MQNNTESYPIVLIPKPLLDIPNVFPTLPPVPIEPKLQLPPEPINPKSAPAQTSKESKPGFFEVIGYIIAIIAFNGFIIYVASKSEAYWVFLIYGFAIISIPFFISSSKKVKAAKREKEEIAFRAYLREKEQYPLRVKEAQRKYSIAMEDCKRQLSDYNAEVEHLKSRSAIVNHRLEMLISFIQQSITKPERVSDNYTKGVSEVFFKQYLSTYFSGYIHDDLAIVNHHYNDDSQLVYKPDFVFYDKYTIAIDIEIDEPYVIETGEPIHYKGADDLRNQFFLNNNWLVIRFSEYQVIKYPDECCFFIANIIKKVAWDTSFLERFKSEITLPPDSSIWSKEAAHKLAYRRVRDALLADLKFDKAKFYQNPNTTEVTYLD